MSDTVKALRGFLLPDACLFDNDKKAVHIISSLQSVDKLHQGLVGNE
jgi:hypothetical protein